MVANGLNKRAQDCPNHLDLPLPRRLTPRHKLSLHTTHAETRLIEKIKCKGHLRMAWEQLLESWEYLDCFWAGFFHCSR